MNSEELAPEQTFFDPSALSLCDPAMWEAPNQRLALVFGCFEIRGAFDDGCHYESVHVSCWRLTRLR